MSQNSRQARQLRTARSNLVGIDFARAMRLAGEARSAVTRRAGFAVNFLG
jgi:hypothetical protein